LTGDGAARLKRILPDDDANILECLREALRRWRSDWRAAFARGGEALEEFSRERFDVVVSDMRMNVLVGVALLRHVQEH
jgi:DNA-binding NtrC family response regulator